MALYPQPNTWTCGPFALKHGLMMLGVFADERKLGRLARTHWWNGTDEIKLARAARASGCELPTIRRKNPDRARRELVSHLRLRRPTLLCIDDWSHWVTVVHVERDRFVVLDSGRPGPVVRVHSWRDLSKAWGHKVKDRDDPDSSELWFDLHPLIPRVTPRTYATLSVARARHLRGQRDGALLAFWDIYFEQVMRVGRPAGRGQNRLTLAELVRRNGKSMQRAVLRWAPKAKPRSVQSVLDDVAFIAETYGIVVPSDLAKRAVIELTAFALARALMPSQ